MIWSDSRRSGQLLARCVVHFSDVIPIHEMVEKCLEIVRSPISIVNVIGMLPNVAAEDRRCPVHEGVLTVGRLADDQLAVSTSAASWRV